tara:strand:- start:3031 stop:4596 length:1566 start_codon:yes stop_codon:yes gene_type:complete
MAKTYDLNFRIKTDATPTRKALRMTNSEFRDFNKTVRASKTPLDRFEKDLSDLNKAFKTGQIRSDQYAFGVKKIEGAYGRASKKQKKFFSGMRSGFRDGAISMAAGFIGYQTVAKGLSMVREQMEAIDKVAKAARGLGTTTEFLSGLEFAAQRTSGLVSGQASKGIEKMTRRIEEAAAGTGEAIKALNRLGIEATSLAKMAPEEQFKVLSRAMDGVTDAGERTLIATKLFDDEQSKLHTTMALSNGQYEEQIELAKRLGKVTTEESAKKAEAYADEMQRYDASMDRMKKAIAMNAMGGVNLVAAESQMARASAVSGFLEGDGAIKADIIMSLLFGGMGEIDREGGVTTTEAIIGRKIARPLDQEALDKQRAGYAAEEAKVNKELAQTLEWEQMLTEEQKKQERNSRFGNFFSDQLKEAKKAATAVKGGLGHLGLSVAGEIDRARNIRRGGDDEFDITKVTRDPMESVGAGSSEAFKLFNQQTSLQKTEKDASKKTAANTKQSSDILGSILGFMESAKGLEL